MSKQLIRRTVLTAVFTALIAASSLFVLPVGPVPVVMTTLFVVLSGMLGGPWIGLSSVITYLLLGIIGLPVFAGGTAGLAKVMGPTGGFLIGYILAALAGGLLFHPKEGGSRGMTMVLAALSALIAGALIYVPGLPWLKYSLSMDWATAIKAGLLPFIPGFLIKTAAATALAFSMKDRFRDFLKSGEEE
ncbi:biotin transporter BioY [Oceanispirochaeta sp.]|jgi:biotin transport system substrate-specific component|uniref:biotin transporter BioY n=1 Tax=Oceanispirochaeta sp. TaxID=2035350 RepID=UPI002628A0DB|nr:biotin transporter BioY [Oceanispirochaeta sp.]MDA3956109.1 biotin transporter BioY [Oceanispirochaeta sp.]